MRLQRASVSLTQRLYLNDVFPGPINRSIPGAVGGGGRHLYAHEVLPMGSEGILPQGRTSWGAVDLLPVSLHRALMAGVGSELISS